MGYFFPPGWLGNTSVIRMQVPSGKQEDQEDQQEEKEGVSRPFVSFQTLNVLSQCRIQQADIKLHNFHFTGDRITAADLERLRDDYPSPDPPACHVNSAVKFLAEIYEDNRYSLCADGLIVSQATSRVGLWLLPAVA